MSTVSSTAWTSDQLNALVSVAVSSASANVSTLESSKTKLNAMSTDITTIKSSVKALKTTLEVLVEDGGMASKKTQLTEEDVMDVSAEPDAVTGNYDVNVVALAQRHRMASASFGDEGTAVAAAAGAGTRTFTIACGDKSEDLTVEVLEGDTDETIMEKLADAINSNCTLATAGIIKENADSSTLLIESSTFGTDGLLTITDKSGTLMLNAGVINASGGMNRQLQAGTDAVLTIGDTLTITRSSNEIADAVNGVTLTLKTTGKTTLTVSVDTDTVVKKFEAFISAYNSAQTAIGTELYEEPDTITEDEYASDLDVTVGTLYGNSQLRSMRNTMRRIMVGMRDLSVGNMAELGVTSVSSEEEGSSEKACNVELDTATLKTMLKKYPEAVKELLIGSNGILTQLNTELAANLKTKTGVISSMETTTDSRLEAVNRRITASRKILEQQTEYYNSLYNSFSSQISGMQTTSQTLSAILGNLSTTSSI